jgi:type IV secretory pathway TraG/TraD family ATPase VirD4
MIDYIIVAGIAFIIALPIMGMKKNNKICSFSELSDFEGDGVKLSKNIRLSTKQSNEHVLMIAPSGLGKTRKFIMPNIKALNNCSIVCTDPSGEIEKTCKTDKQTFVLSPFNEKTIGYDPIKLCNSEFEVKKIASVILKNGMIEDNGNNRQEEFLQMAAPLLTAYMLYNYYMRKYNFGELIQNICTMPILPFKNKEIPSIYGEIMDSDVESAKTELKMFLQVMGSPETLSSIRIVMNSCLQSLLDQRILNIFKKPCIDIKKIRKEESIIYIQVPERHCNYYAPLTATFLTQLLDSLLENDGLQTYLLFDEFTNIGKIPNMCQLLSTARKRKISIIAAIQSLTQLYRVYGEIQGNELRELFKSIIVGAGLKDSAEYISQMLGNKQTKKNETFITEPLMTPDEIRRMKNDKILIICNNKRPVIDELLDLVI